MMLFRTITLTITLAASETGQLAGDDPNFFDLIVSPSAPVYVGSDPFPGGSVDPDTWGALLQAFPHTLKAGPLYAYNAGATSLTVGMVITGAIAEVVQSGSMGGSDDSDTNSFG